MDEILLIVTFLVEKKAYYIFLSREPYGKPQCFSENVEKKYFLYIPLKSFDKYPKREKFPRVAHNYSEGHQTVSYIQTH